MSWCTAPPSSVTVLRLRVAANQVPGTTFQGGHRVPLVPPPASVPRHLDAERIRRALPQAVVPAESHRIQLISDLSGSMWGGNDVTGLRHEAALVALEHLAARQRRGAPWIAEVLSFDLSSAIDTPPTALDRRGLTRLRSSLLSRPTGGSSILGPSLTTAEQGGPRRVLIVMSDFELFDGDVPGVLDQLANSGAHEVLALVFRSAPPPQIMNTRVRVVAIDPARDGPEQVATHIVSAANSACLRPEERS